MKTIRIADRSDAPGLVEIYAPIVAASHISFETEPPTEQEMGSRVAAALTFAPWLVCVDGGRVDGYAYASRHRDRAAYRWCVDVSVYVRDGVRRAGIGRALYTSLFALLAMQGFYAAHAGITLPNDASVGLHESLGFRLVGVYPRVGFKCDAWYDVGWWQLELRDRTGEPRPTLSMEAMRKSPQWIKAVAKGQPIVER